MMDQSDTWRFDIPNLPHEITRMIIDTVRCSERMCYSNRPDSEKICRTKKKPTRKKYDKPKITFLFSSVINNASPIA